MILAAGLSPALQQIVLLDRLQVGAVNRAREVHWCASGKVLNVGLALQTLAGDDPPPGTDARVLCLTGGNTGQAIQREFASHGVPARWVDSAAPTRVCTTILDRDPTQTTELVGNALPITEDELHAFHTAYAAEARQASVVVLTGSCPAGTPPTLFRDLLAVTPCPAIVDAQRDSLLAALEQRPHVVKPNREELGNTLGRPVETEPQLRDALRELCHRGAHWVVMTQGRERVWICSSEACWTVTPPVVPVVNPIGCGDCLAAGLALGLARGSDVPGAVLLGVAAAADNATRLLPARLDPDQVARWQLELTLEPA